MFRPDFVPIRSRLIRRKTGGPDHRDLASDPGHTMREGPPEHRGIDPGGYKGSVSNRITVRAVR